MLFTNRPSKTARPVRAPTTVRVEASGLEMSMSITPGPYFLSEVLVADMTLTNHTNTTFMLREGLCYPALRLKQTGGKSPHYTLPLHGNTPVSNPLGHWPSLQIQVASHIPSDRLFSLHLQGSQVHINAPPALHLLYHFIVSCDSYGVTIDTGNSSWEPISTRVLGIPGSGCPGNMRWQYAVSAVGYAVVAGKYPM
jgi:hypothetical protein